MHFLAHGCFCSWLFTMTDKVTSRRMKLLTAMELLLLIHAVCSGAREIVLRSDNNKKCTVEIGRSEISSTLLEQIFWENLSVLYPQYVIAGATYTISPIGEDQYYIQQSVPAQQKKQARYLCPQCGRAYSHVTDFYRHKHYCIYEWW